MQLELVHFWIVSQFWINSVTIMLRFVHKFNNKASALIRTSDWLPLHTASDAHGYCSI